jgi:nucleotide-binding universal stress UspA family protein
MKTIIAATDFSDNSLNAADYAAAMACFTRDKLVLFHACPLPLAFGEVPVPVVTKEELLAEAGEKMANLKNKLLYNTHDRLEIETVIEQGELVTQLGKYCDKAHPFAVVIGSETASAIERLLIGGRTTAVVHRLSWPVIVIPKDAKFSHIKKIGMACDFKEVMDTIPVKQIESLVKIFKAELHVIYVNEEDRVNEANLVQQSRSLENILEGLKPRYHFLNDGDIEGSITRYLDRHKFDLLIIIPKKHSIVDKLFHSSQSKKMVLHAQIPIISFHE